MGWGEFIGNSLAAYRSTKKRLEMEDQCLNIKDYCSPEAQHNVAEILLDSCLPGSAILLKCFTSNSFFSG